MTTILFLALVVALVTVAAIVALLHAVHGAAEGYEDEFQFHHGVRSQSSPTPSPLVAAALEEKKIDLSRSKRRPQMAGAAAQHRRSSAG